MRLQSAVSLDQFASFGLVPVRRIARGGRRRRVRRGRGRAPAPAERGTLTRKARPRGPHGRDLRNGAVTRPETGLNASRRCAGWWRNRCARAVWRG